MACKHLTDRKAARCYYCGVNVSQQDHSQDDGVQLDHVRTQVKHLLYDKGFSLMEIAEAIVRWELSRTSGMRTFRQDQCYDNLIKNFSELRDIE